MCIIAYKPKDVAISPETLLTCYMNNPDGAGYMYPCENRLLIKKGFFTHEDFSAAWQKTHKIYGDDLPVVFHFRISTSGKIDKTNCHPHRIAPDLAFVHNGILSCVRPPRKSRVSDTIMYRDKFLAELTGASLRRTAFFAAVGDHIGFGNKFVFMNGKGKVAICNEEQGDWHEGIWYSNTSHKRDARWKHSFLSDEDCCECCGQPLTFPEELAAGICAECVELYGEPVMQCGGCGEPLTAQAHRETGWCDFCGEAVYGRKDWKRMLRDYARPARGRDVPF